MNGKKLYRSESTACCAVSVPASRNILISTRL